MNIEQLKFLILQTRNQLAGLYAWKAVMKDCKRQCDEEGDVKAEYEAHNEVKRVSKQIAKLVTVQKSLKADVQEQLGWERTIRAMQKAGTDTDSGMAWDE